MRSFKISVIKFLSVFSLMLMLGTSIAFAQVSVTFPTISGAVGSSKTVPITVGDLTNLNVTSYQFVLDYDQTLFDVTGISTVGTKSEVGNIEPNIDLANGKLLVAWANGTALTGSGTLLNVNITFKNSPGQNFFALLPGTTFMFNGGVPGATIVQGLATSANIQVYVEDKSTSGLTNEFLIPIKTTTLATADNVLSFDFTGTYDPAKIEITGYETANTLGPNATVELNTTVPGTVKLAWANGSVITGAGTLVFLKAKGKAKGTSVLSLDAFKFNAGLPTVVTAAGNITLVNIKPVFGAVTALTFNEAQVVTNQVLATATDADGDVLTYTATGVPTGATVTANKLTWTPSYTQAGTYTIVLTANDGVENSDPVSVSITVKDVNRTPTISLNPAAPYTVNEGQLLTFKVVFGDQDTDNTLTLSATGVPSGATFKAATGDFSWTPLYNQAGTYNLIFTVKDNYNAFATIPATITVNNTNTAPSFTVAGAKQMPDTTILGGKNLIYTFKAVDAEGDPVTYYLQDPKPDGAVIVASTGVFGWKPSNLQAKATPWQIVVVASDGVFSTISRIAYVKVDPDTKVDDEVLPTAFELFQNYPNPFNPTTSIRFALPKDSQVRLAVYNILGQEVVTLTNSMMTAGYHIISFDAKDLPSGMYIYKIDAGNFSQIKKMLLMK